MDDTLSLRTLHTVGVDMRHNVMAHLAFPLLRHLIVNIVRMGFQLVNLLLGDIQSQFFFRLCKSDPQSPPCAEFHIRRKDILHFPACIAL